MNDHSPSSDWRTLPNLVTMIRILGSPALILLALADRPIALAACAVVLVFTEWLDGFLARRLHASSAIGARLDTVADAVFYSCLLAAIILLRPQTAFNEAGWILVAITSYSLSWLVSWRKFGCLPSYHTWAAKGVWVLVGTGIVCLLSDLAAWPFRLAMVAVALTNLEAIGISMTLADCRVDVPSLWHARRIASAPEATNIQTANGQATKSASELSAK